MIHKNRTIYRSLIIGSFIGVLMILIFGISQILSYLNTGADRSTMLHQSLQKEKVYFPKLVWKDTLNPGRPIEKQTLLDIEQDYLNAWYIRNVAYQTNTIDGVEDYYTKNARQHIYNLVAYNRDRDIEIHSTTLDHSISLDFYSADGQLAVISDNQVQEYQRVYQKQQLQLEEKLQSNYQMLLLLEDGFWRIRHMVKKSVDDRKLINRTQENGFANIIDGKIYLNNKQYKIKGINYYPQETPWNMFGDHFDSKVIAKDFDIIKKAGLNTVRIFVPYKIFGRGKVRPEMLDQFEQVLDNAASKNLQVIVTLFDFYGDYSVLDWTLTHRHAEQIVSSFKDHKAILAWDIKNEPNLDFASRKKENVVAWLSEMIDQIRQYDSNHLITIGWSDMTSAAILQDKVDMVSFHYYKNIDDFETNYQQLVSKIDKPLVLQEFGLSSSRGLWSPFGASEKTQAHYYEQFQKINQQNDIHYLSWTLYDFKEVPSSVVGKLPWRKHKQKHFGFIDSNGKKKPAFEFIRE
ncbi:cellulase family glycosylhydrolase [Aquimarina sp. 2201CG1-2-11]|uniref:cellulase family glycosylhydrolase n=1 Tax=Aquimarina discodermiae TaxID=3231043 RepID=UPI0034636F31